jgi:hypothetical protein
METAFDWGLEEPDHTESILAVPRESHGEAVAGEKLSGCAPKVLDLSTPSHRPIMES